ncbi:hypothetical protein FBU30_000145, partial [Linnemannia zychae]
SFVFYIDSKSCGGGLSDVRNIESTTCVSPAKDKVYQSIQYRGFLSGALEGYSLKERDYCGNFITRGYENCVDSGETTRFTGAKFRKEPTNPCGKPSICLMNKKSAEEMESMSREAFRHVDGWVMYEDVKSDISYLIDPKTIEQVEYQKVVEGDEAQRLEYFKKNHTFSVKRDLLWNKEMWIYRVQK